MLPKDQKVTLFLTIQCQNQLVICVKLHKNRPTYATKMGGVVENGSSTLTEVGGPQVDTSNSTYTLGVGWDHKLSHLNNNCDS